MGRRTDAHGSENDDEEQQTRRNQDEHDSHEEVETVLLEEVDHGAELLGEVRRELGDGPYTAFAI